MLQCVPDWIDQSSLREPLILPVGVAFSCPVIRSESWLFP